MNEERRLVCCRLLLLRCSHSYRYRRYHIVLSTTEESDHRLYPKLVTEHTIRDDEGNSADGYSKLMPTTSLFKQYDMNRSREAESKSTSSILVKGYDTRGGCNVAGCFTGVQECRCDLDPYCGSNYCLSGSVLGGISLGPLGMFVAKISIWRDADTKVISFRTGFSG